MKTLFVEHLLAEGNVQRIIGALMCVSACLWVPVVTAELRGLTESELSGVSDAGIGLVLENFKFSHGTDVPDENGNQGRIFKIGALKSSDGRDVEIVVYHLYISGAGSNYGQNRRPVNLGRLVNPFTVDVVDGNSIGIADQAVLQFAAPTLIDPSQGFNCLGVDAVGGVAPAPVVRRLPITWGSALISACK